MRRRPGAVAQLDDGDAVLVVDETADEKSSADAVGAARQYSGTVGGIALCQVAVTLTFATSHGHTLIDRALYLPQACAADDEHRELAGGARGGDIRDQAGAGGALLDRAHQRGIRAAFVTGDEDYGGRDLRRAIRALGMGYVLAVRANHTLALGSGRTLTAGLGWERKRTELTRRPWSPSSLAWRGLPGPTDSRSASGGMSTVTRSVSSRAGAPPSPRALPSFQAGLLPDSVNRAW
jgi:SRSO17 transposase